MNTAADIDPTASTYPKRHADPTDLSAVAKGDHLAIVGSRWDGTVTRRAVERVVTVERTTPATIWLVGERGEWKRNGGGQRGSWAGRHLEIAQPGDEARAEQTVLRDRAEDARKVAKDAATRAGDFDRAASHFREQAAKADADAAEKRRESEAKAADAIRLDAEAAAIIVPTTDHTS